MLKATFFILTTVSHAVQTEPPAWLRLDSDSVVTTQKSSYVPVETKPGKSPFYFDGMRDEEGNLVDGVKKELTTPPAPVDQQAAQTESMESPHLWKQTIHDLFRAKKYKEVISNVDAFLQQNTPTDQLVYQKAHSLYKLKNYSEALLYFDQALSLKPEFRDAHYDRANVLVKLKRYEEGLEAFDKAVALGGGNSWLHYDRAVLLRRMGRGTQALEGFKKSVEMNSRNSWAFLELGNLYYQKRQWVHAMKYYKKTLELNPKAPGVQRNLERCIQKLEG